jgi:hypothetical protein
MTLTVKLPEQEQMRLEALIVAMQVGTQSDTVRALINEKFEALQVEKTLAERRGGHPQHLLQGEANLSDRDTRKAVFAEKVASKIARRRGK